MLTFLLGLSYASIFVNEVGVQGSAPYVLNGIVMPRILYPTFILPEGSFEARVLPVQGVDVWTAVLSNEFGNYELKVESATFNLTDNLVTLKLKAQQATPGLYTLDLTAFTASGAVVAHYREPNSVSVRASFNLPFRVLWITDTHIDDRPDLPTGTSAINFRRIVRLANFLRPDFILHTGDVVNMGNPLLFPLAYSLIQDLEVPMIACPGNHDHVVGGDYFTQYFAPRNGSFNVGPVHFVTLDTGPGSIIGELSDSQLTWLDRDLTANDQSKFKILMFHHPMFNTDNPRNDTVQPVYGIALRHGVNLILNGHMHEDIVFHGPILTLVTANAYEGGKPYSGIRMLTISDSGIEWHYAGGEPQIPLYDFDITYSQPNDGKSYGIVVDLANRWKMSVSGVLRLRVGYGQFLKVEGATYSSLTNRTDYTIITVPVTLAQGETRKITAYTRLDNEPPVVESSNFTSTQGPTINVAEFHWKIYDSVLGMKNADMYYSTDNMTWTKKPLTEIEPRIFWARLQFDKSTNQVFYYVVALDMQGLSTTSRTLSGSLTQPSGTLSTTGTQSPQGTTGQGFDIMKNTWMLGLVVVLLAAIAVGFVYLRRRSK
jgi:Icc protein